MNRITHSIWISFVIVLLLSTSCTIEKRLYMSGYHVDWNNNNSHKNKLAKNDVQIELKESKIKESTQDLSSVSNYNTNEIKEEIINEENIIASSSNEVISLTKTGINKSANNSFKSSVETKTPTIYPPQQNIKKEIVNNLKTTDDGKNGLATAGFVLSIISFFLGWIPFLGWSMWLLGFIFSFIGIFKAPRGLAIAGLVISLIGIIITLLLTAAIFGQQMAALSILF